MDTTKKERLDELITRLEMQSALKPLRDSSVSDDDYYEHFERAIETYIENYERRQAALGKKSIEYVTTTIAYCTKQSFPAHLWLDRTAYQYWYRIGSGDARKRRLISGETIKRYEEQEGGILVAEITRHNRVSISVAPLFKQYFGIGCTPMSYDEIAAQRGVVKPYLPQYIQTLVSHFVELLRARDRTEIWYKTLPNDGDLPEATDPGK